MTNTGRMRSTKGDPMSWDAFGRVRVSQPHTLFDSKQLGDNRAMFWYDAAVSGSGTNSTYNINDSSSVLSVSANTAGRRVRRTYQYFNYQPGKSHLVMMTFNMNGHKTGVTKKVGYFDDNNGFYLECTETGTNLVKRSYVTGQVVETRVAQEDWMNPLNRADSAYPVLDWTKSQIFFMDMEWLGVGGVRFGFVINNTMFYVHNMYHANSINSTYITTPNLQLRYELIASGTNEAATLTAICASIMSEGGLDATGVIHSVSGGGTPTLNGTTTAANVYAAVGLKLKSTCLNRVVKLVDFSMMSSGNDDFEWMILLNPTSVAGTFTYSDVTNSAVQTAIGSGSANIVTGGTMLHSGYARQGTSIAVQHESLRYIGVNSSGTSEELLVAHRPITSNATMYSSMTWREFA